MTPKYKFFDTEKKEFVDAEWADACNNVWEFFIAPDGRPTLGVSFNYGEQNFWTQDEDKSLGISCPEELRHVIAVEWTGCLDSYDNPIYDGDIVNHIELNEKLLVKKKEGDLLFRFFDKNGESYVDDEITHINDLRGLEFIGSSLTNPELLTC